MYTSMRHGLASYSLGRSKPSERLSSVENISNVDALNGDKMGTVKGREHRICSDRVEMVRYGGFGEIV